ncbi:hypothetical protein TNIN_79161 [Trichonephila inaurata madagascariensis]|uniref:Uncharacterized protein n=1 Tax=Trichonephila inaurata madagascariensis TaxID=2747483 RepID=A0A8X7C4N3_9ARAC|nr:hypothetical protein TNIN_79161 [Trichonephila inaurata madagascariensis]
MGGGGESDGGRLSGWSQLFSLKNKSCCARCLTEGACAQKIVETFLSARLPFGKRAVVTSWMTSWIFSLHII